MFRYRLYLSVLFLVCLRLPSVAFAADDSCGGAPGIVKKGKYYLRTSQTKCEKGIKDCVIEGQSGECKPALVYTCSAKNDIQKEPVNSGLTKDDKDRILKYVAYKKEQNPHEMACLPVRICYCDFGEEEGLTVDEDSEDCVNYIDDDLPFQAEGLFSDEHYESGYGEGFEWESHLEGNSFILDTLDLPVREESKEAPE